MARAVNAKIGALVLAAGFSNRFGSIKLCATLPNGNTVFQQTLNNLLGAVSDIIVVTRDEIATRLPKTQAPILIFDSAEKGMGATLAFGITQLPDDWDACLVCLADMPFISSLCYRNILAALGPDSIVLPRYEGKPGNPVGFGRRFFTELAQLGGDQGGKAVMKKHADSVIALELNDPAILYDIDTPDDLARFNSDASPED